MLKYLNVFKLTLRSIITLVDEAATIHYKSCAIFVNFVEFAECVAK